MGIYIYINIYLLDVYVAHESFAIMEQMFVLTCQPVTGPAEGRRGTSVPPSHTIAPCHVFAVDTSASTENRQPMKKDPSWDFTSAVNNETPAGRSASGQG